MIASTELKKNKMLNVTTKAFYAIALAFSAAAFTGCDDDDDEKFDSIVGSWQGTKTEFELHLEGVPTPITETDEDFAGEVEFKQDGTAVFEEDGDVVSGTWNQNGDKLTLTIANDDDLSGTYTIQELTSSKLRLYIEKEGTFEDPDTGINLDGTVKGTLYFNKK